MTDSDFLRVHQEFRIRFIRDAISSNKGQHQNEMGNKKGQPEDWPNSSPFVKDTSYLSAGKFKLENSGLLKFFIVADSSDAIESRAIAILE